MGTWSLNTVAKSLAIILVLFAVLFVFEGTRNIGNQGATGLATSNDFFSSIRNFFVSIGILHQPVCDKGEVRACGITAGACRTGTQQCVDGKWDVCVGASYPSAEVCDDIDNDCDGFVNEGLTC